jgi:hypothetical protein
MQSVGSFQRRIRYKRALLPFNETIMARKQPGRKPATQARPAPARSTPRARPRAKPRSGRPQLPALLRPIPDAEHHTVGTVEIDVQRAGTARVKRVIYPPGFRWSTHMKPVTGTDRCMHAHVGFIAHGRIHMEYPDGSVVEYRAPQIVTIEPEHDGWVVGREPAVLIEFDFERDTVARLALPETHHRR